MDDKAFIKDAVSKGEYWIEYVKPSLMIQKWSDDENGFGNIQYVVQDIDTDDYGGVLIFLRGDEDAVKLFLDWKSGEWSCSDEIIPREDIPQPLLKAIAPLDVSLGVSAHYRQLWRIAIGKMEETELSETDQVLFADDFHEQQLYAYHQPF